MSKKISAKELERKLGLQYAQVLKENAHKPLYQDCKETIDASLRIMEYYNRISVAMQNAGTGSRAFG